MSVDDYDIGNEEQTAQTVSEVFDYGMKQILNRFVSINPVEDTMMRDRDRYGNIKHGFIQQGDVLMFGKRNTNGRTIVDDTVQPPKTKANPYSIQLVGNRQKIEVEDVSHDEPVEEEHLDEESMVTWFNEDGLELLLNGEYGDIEEFHIGIEEGTVRIRVYEPNELGYTEITISGFHSVQP